MDRERTMLINSPNIEGWNHQPLKQELERRLGTSVRINNDAALAGLGEAVYGAGKECDIVVYMTVSTGVGGARIVNRLIDPSSRGFEPGHQTIDADGTLCPSCNTPKQITGDLEYHISGSALKRRLGTHPSEVQDEDIWDEHARWLAYGLNNTIVHWSPDIIILGGSMMLKTPGISIDRVREYTAQTVKIFPDLPEIKLAELKDSSGLYGALELARQTAEQNGTDSRTERS